MTEQPAAVLWDMDGTIIDTEPAWIIAERELLREWGSELTAQDAIDWVGIGLWDLAEIFRERGVDLSADDIVDTLSQRVDTHIFAGNLAWRPGARELLQELTQAGIPNVLVTMATRAQALAITSHLPADTFAAVIAGDDVPHPKPHPAPYQQGARSQQLDPASCVAIEDSRIGVTSAARAGCVVVAVPNLQDLHGTAYDVSVDTLQDMSATRLIHIYATRKAVNR